jgi:hypothetical protein
MLIPAAVTAAPVIAPTAATIAKVDFDILAVVAGDICLFKHPFLRYSSMPDCLQEMTM